MRTPAGRPAISSLERWTHACVARYCRVCGIHGIRDPDHRYTDTCVSIQCIFGAYDNRPADKVDYHIRRCDRNEGERREARTGESLRYDASHLHSSAYRSRRTEFLALGTSLIPSHATRAFFRTRKHRPLSVSAHSNTHEKHLFFTFPRSPI